MPINWEELKRKYLETDPHCSECGDKLYHFSYTGICGRCQEINAKIKMAENSPPKIKKRRGRPPLRKEESWK